MKPRVVAAMVFLSCTGCVTTRKAGPETGGGSVRPVKVYFEGKGAEREVRRFGKILEIALEDNQMEEAGSPQGADAVVKARITREEQTVHFQVPRFLLTLASAGRTQYVVEECNGMSTGESIYSQQVNYVGPFKLPEDWTEAHPHFAVYIDAPNFKGHEELIAALKRRLLDTGYRVARARGEADGELASIKMQRLDVPMRAMSRDIAFEVFDKDGRRYYYTSGQGTTDRAYLGVQPPFKLESLPCRDQLKNLANMNTDDGSWREARGIAGKILEHMGKTVHSN